MTNLVLVLRLLLLLLLLSSSLMPLSLMLTQACSHPFAQKQSEREAVTDERQTRSAVLLLCGLCLCRRGWQQSSTGSDKDCCWVSVSCLRALLLSCVRSCAARDDDLSLPLPLLDDDERDLQTARGHVSCWFSCRSSLVSRFPLSPPDSLVYEYVVLDASLCLNELRETMERQGDVV